MPKLSVWLIRVSMLYMSLSFLLGALLLLNKGASLSVWVWRLLNPHIEVMVFGWVMQFVIGVAFWILPRFTQEPRYGRMTLGWCGFGLLNGGVICATGGAWAALDSLLLVGRLVFLVGMLVFAFVLWPRVKAFGQP